MPRIDMLYAWVVPDGGDPDNEGVPTFLHPAGFFAPMMGSDLVAAEAMEYLAQGMCDSMGLPMRLVRSTGLEQVKLIVPKVQQIEI